MKNPKDLLNPNFYIFSKFLMGGDIILEVSERKEDPRSLFQRLFRQSYFEVVHAGIMSDCNNLIEAGLTKCNIRLKLYYHFKRAANGRGIYSDFIVFRAINSQMAEGAATGAQLLFDIHNAHDSVGYPSNLLKLAPSVMLPRGKPQSIDAMEKIYQKIINSKKSPMFCSQLVVYIYQWVITQMGRQAKEIFNIDANRASPARLASMLAESSRFTNLGILML